MFLWHHQTCAKKTALFHMTPKRGTVKPITWCCSTRAAGDFVTLWLIVNTKPRINVPNISRTWTPCNMHGVGVMESRGGGGASGISNRKISAQKYWNSKYKNMTIPSTPRRHGKYIDLTNGVVLPGVRFVRVEFNSLQPRDITGCQKSMSPVDVVWLHWHQVIGGSKERLFFTRITIIVFYCRERQQSWQLTHCGLVTPNGDIDLGQHQLR